MSQASSDQRISARGRRFTVSSSNVHGLSPAPPPAPPLAPPPARHPARSKGPGDSSKEEGEGEVPSDADPHMPEAAREQQVLCCVGDGLAQIDRIAGGCWE
eukprot:768481-Hanusia_phi.AAC.4